MENPIPQIPGGAIGCVLAVLVLAGFCAGSLAAWLILR